MSDSDSDEGPRRKRKKSGSKQKASAAPSILELMKQDQELGSWTDAAVENVAESTIDDVKNEAGPSTLDSVKEEESSVPHRPSVEAQQPTPDVFFKAAGRNQPLRPTLTVPEVEHTTFTRALQQANAQGDESVALLVTTGWLYTELSRDGCPEAVARWLFELTAFSRESYFATAAFQALRGLMTDDKISPSCVSGTWVPAEKTPTQEKLKWCPGHTDFVQILRKFGADVADTPGDGETHSPGGSNLGYIFELWAFAIGTQPRELFSVEDVVAAMQIAARAVLDPVANQTLPSLQVLWAALVQWPSAEQWPTVLSQACQAMLHEQVTTQRSARLRVARSLPPTERCWSLRRELGIRIARTALPTQNFKEPVVTEADTGRDHLLEIQKRLRSVEPGFMQASLLELLEAVDLSVDSKPMLTEAKREEVKAVFDALRKVESGMTSRRIGLKAQIKESAERLLNCTKRKLVTYVPGLDRVDELG